MEDKCVEGIILSIIDYKIIKGAQTAQHQGDIKYGVSRIHSAYACPLFQ